MLSSTARSVRGNRLAISNSSSASGWEARCTGFYLRAAPSAAADLWDQVDLAVGIERGEVGVLEDFSVDRHRHAFFDLTAEPREAAVELQDHPAEIIRLHLKFGLPAGEPAGGLAREMDARHFYPSFPRKRESRGQGLPSCPGPPLSRGRR